VWRRRRCDRGLRLRESNLTFTRLRAGAGRCSLTPSLFPLVGERILSLSTETTAAGPRRVDRRSLLLGAGAAFGVGVPRVGSAAPITPPNRFLRIAAGNSVGTYFALGGLIASVVSNPPGGPPCEKGGACGVPGLIAVAQTTSGAVENINLLRAGEVEAAFVQSDTAYWAATGTGTFRGEAPFTGLRSIGALYVEAIHLVTRADSPVRSIADLRGRVVSLGETASGTLAEAKLMLEAHGLDVGLITSLNLKLASAAERLAKGEIDAFFIVGGVPLPGIAELASATPIRLVAIEGPEVDEFIARRRFLRPVRVAADAYAGVAETPTLGVGAELVTTDRVDPDLIEAVTRVLWTPAARKVLVEGHPRGRDLSPEFAARAAAIPPHEGAARVYRDLGVLPDTP